MFKLPNQKLRSPMKARFNKEKASIPGNPVLRKDLDPGVLGEANMDGSIYLSNNIEPGSPLEKEVLEHEMKHANEMKLGKLSYDDDSITHNGKKYERKNGKIKYKGKWKPEGSEGFPWESH